MKKNCESKKAVVQPIVLQGSRQLVESAIDASKSFPNRSWEASARAARRRGQTSQQQKDACAEDE